MTGSSRLSPARRKMLSCCISRAEMEASSVKSGVFENYAFPYLSIHVEDATMLCGDPLIHFENVLSSGRLEVPGFSEGDHTLSASSPRELNASRD